MGAVEVAFDERLRRERFYLREDFKKCPALAAVLVWPGAYAQATHQATEIANADFEVSGVNMTTALSTFNTGGGITLTTAGASGDQALLGTSTTTTETVWKATQWSTSQQASFDCMLKTGASVAGYTLTAGLKLTSTPASATDADQCYFRMNDTENSSQWQFITSRASVVTTTVGGTDRIPAVVASTIYRLRIVINSDRTVSGYVGVGPTGNLVEVSKSGPLPALTASINLLPFIGVQAGAAAAKAATVFYVECGRLLA